MLELKKNNASNFFLMVLLQGFFFVFSIYNFLSARIMSNQKALKLKFQNPFLTLLF
jgi:hypothetical protein